VWEVIRDHLAEGGSEARLRKALPQLTPARVKAASRADRASLAPTAGRYFGPGEEAVRLEMSKGADTPTLPAKS
jgi:hypothetical protein